MRAGATVSLASALNAAFPRKQFVHRLEAKWRTRIVDLAVAAASDAGCMTTQAWGCLRAVKHVDGYPEFDARVRLARWFRVGTGTASRLTGC